MYVALSDPDYIRFQQWLGPFLVDWRTTMHANGFLTIFQTCWHPIKKEKYNPATSITSMYVTLRLPPLDSENGWSGELWSKTNLLHWQIAFFSPAKKNFFKNFRWKKRFLEILGFFDHFCPILDFGGFSCIFGFFFFFGFLIVWICLQYIYFLWIPYKVFKVTTKSYQGHYWRPKMAKMGQTA